MYLLYFIIYMFGMARVQRTWIRFRISCDHTEFAFWEMPAVSQFLKRPSNSFALQKEKAWVPLPWVFNYKYHLNSLGTWES